MQVLLSVARLMKLCWLKVCLHFNPTRDIFNSSLDWSFSHSSLHLLLPHAGKPDECLIQDLSDHDAVASRYWRIGRLLGLSIDAMEHIEESVTEGLLKKKVLEVFRKWQEIQGGSTLCLFQVLHYLKIDLKSFIGHMSAINRAETDLGRDILVLHASIH